MMLFNVLHLCMVLVVFNSLLVLFYGLRFSREAWVLSIFSDASVFWISAPGRRPDSSSTAVVGRCVTVVASLPSPI